MYFSPVPYSNLLVDRPSSLGHKPSKLRQYYTAESLSILSINRALILQWEGGEGGQRIYVSQDKQ